MKLQSRLRWAALAFSAFFCGWLAFCYGARPDSCAAVTLWPAWIMAIPGVALALAGAGLNRKIPFLIVLALWLAFIGFFVTEIPGLLRFRAGSVAKWETARTQGKAVRVVSLNCAGGSKEAAAETGPYRADVVLLQETPVRKEAEELAKRLYGPDAGIAFGMDCAILARGRVEPISLPAPLKGAVTMARVRLTTGREMNVVSLRLIAPVFQIDLWNPECWRVQTENRRARREQLHALLPFLAALPEATPLLIGGDWNAPAGDAIFALLKPRLRDSFVEAGRGWGNTATNELPLVRIDQIWVSRDFRAADVRAHATANSDHRLVVGDFFLR